MKKISLTRGKFALVDDQDFEWLNQWKWPASACGYAIRNKPPLDLANISGEYKRDIGDYDWLCRSCHKIKDCTNKTRQKLRISALKRKRDERGLFI